MLAGLVIEVFEDIGMKCGSEAGRICVIKSEEVDLNGTILGAKILIELCISYALQNGVPLGDRVGIRLLNMNYQGPVGKISKVCQSNCSECARNKRRKPGMTPIKPSRDAAIAHGTKEALNAENITNPTCDVIH